MRRASIHEQYYVGTGGRVAWKHPPNTYSAALARGLPSKGEMGRASMLEQYDIGTGGRLGSNIPPAPFKGGDATGKHTRTI